MLFVFFAFISLTLGSPQITFNSNEFQPLDLNLFMAFAGQDIAISSTQKDDLRYISNSAALASIPKGKIIYHLTNVDPKSLMNDTWEDIEAMYFCTLPDHCLLYSKEKTQQYLLAYEVTEDIDQLIHFAGNHAWTTTYTPIQAFVYGNISSILYDKTKPFCDHYLKPKGWVTSYVGSFEFVLCNCYSTTPSFLKLISAVPIVKYESVFPGTLMLNLLPHSTLNDFVDVHYGTLTLLNPYFKMKKAKDDSLLPTFNLPGLTTSQQQAKDFQKRLFEFYKDDSCWKDSKHFLNYERKVRTALKPFLNTLYALFYMITPETPTFYSLSMLQGYLFSIMMPYQEEVFESIFLPIPEVKSECGKKMKKTFQNIYESSQRVLKMIRSIFDDLYVGEIKRDDPSIPEKYEKILKGLQQFRDLFGTIQIKLPLPSQ